MKTKYLSIIIAAALIGPLSAQKDQLRLVEADAHLKEQAVESVLFEAQPGTTLGEFLKSHHEKLIKLNTSIAVSSEAAKFKLPGFKVSLKDNASDLRWLFEEISDDKLISKIQSIESRPQYLISFRMRTVHPNEAKEVKIYALEFLKAPKGRFWGTKDEQLKLSVKRQKKDEEKLGSCEELIALSFSIAELEQPSIKFHKATNTMIVNGNAKQQALIEQVIESLK